LSYILNIETAVAGASVCLSTDEHILSKKENAEPKDGAAWIQPAIRELLAVAGISMQQLNAVAVSSGPGSYTGLRVGMATAKGLCYALKIPLITLNTLQVMAAAFRGGNGLLCPMIDARRMEVFTALFDKDLNEVMPSRNLVLNPDSFDDILQTNVIHFFGNGSSKFSPLLKNKNAFFHEILMNASNMPALALIRFKQQVFSDLAYAEPFYGKGFYAPAFPPSE
jgi:tRNA threonylcarbamoyladenosine biosynthesis protein TsaB